MSKNQQELEGRFDFRSPGFDWVPRYNIVPTQPVVAVLNDGERHAELLRWGLIPSWATDPSIGNLMINARAETVASKPSFRSALRKRRCLVIADGFYEWKRVKEGKTPMFIALKSGEAFAFAGLWEAWRAPSRQWTRSCTIITTTANTMLEQVHSRMPVILSREAEGVWLDHGVEEPAELVSLLTPYPSEAMQAYAVSPRVNSPRNDGPECVLPLSPM